MAALARPKLGFLPNEQGNLLSLNRSSGSLDTTQGDSKPKLLALPASLTNPPTVLFGPGNL